MRYQYNTKGVCSKNINFDIEDGRVTNVEFLGGCAGNTTGVARLIEGMPIDEAISKMKGIRCGKKDTSCPDQLALALEKSKQEAEWAATEASCRAAGQR